MAGWRRGRVRAGLAGRRGAAAAAAGVVAARGLCGAAGAGAVACWRWRWRGAACARWRCCARRWRCVGFAQHRAARARSAWPMRLPAALEGQDLVVTGVVAELPRQVPDGRALPLRGRAAQRATGEPVRGAARASSLGWYRGWHERRADRRAVEALRAGQRWRFTVRLSQPHGTLNPHGFDFELWLFEQGIARHRRRARDRAQPAAAAARQRRRTRSSGCASACATRSCCAWPIARAAGVLAALAVGDQARHRARATGTCSATPASRT